jgi:uncharacterized protein (TIGR03083 family)
LDRTGCSNSYWGGCNRRRGCDAGGAGAILQLGHAEMPDIQELPIPPSTIKHGAIAELDHVVSLVQRLSPADWGRRSAVETWTIGDIVVHLDLFLGIYSRMLGVILGGGGSSGLAKAIGWLTSSVMPAAAPVFDSVNGAVPKVLGRILAPVAVKRQFAAGARKTRESLVRTHAADYTRPVYYEGSPYPLSFYLAIIVNELALHGWDIESQMKESVELSAAACRILPWFFWGGSNLMLRPPKGTRGIVHVLLSDPESVMTWSITDASIEVGREKTTDPDAEIRGPSSTYVLAIAGRLKAPQVRQSFTIKGDRGLADRFLESWHLI